MTIFIWIKNILARLIRRLSWANGQQKQRSAEATSPGVQEPVVCPVESRDRFISRFRHTSNISDEVWRAKIMPLVYTLAGISDDMAARGLREEAKDSIKAAKSLCEALSEEMSKLRSIPVSEVNYWQTRHLLIIKHFCDQLVAQSVGTIVLDLPNPPAFASRTDEWFVIQSGAPYLAGVFGYESKRRVWCALKRGAEMLEDAYAMQRSDKLYLNKTRLCAGAVPKLPLFKK